MNTHFKIIIPSFNNERWIKACLNSVKKQNYDNYQCIVIDDTSTDNSVSIIKETIGQNPNFVFICNKKRKLALRNIYEGIEILKPKPEDVIVTLDGDDFLFGFEVLNKLNEAYINNHCWMTYGSYSEFPSKGQKGKFGERIPYSVIESNTFRESRWMSSHMRTFKYQLWNRINKEDLLMDNGEFCDGAWDMAFMFPMLEMSGHKSHFIDSVIYIYNRSNPLNEDKKDHLKLYKSESRIRKMKKYKRIEL